jgi:hypothetical protein
MKHKLTTVVLATALVTVTDTAWSRSAWTQPGWATRLAQALSAGAACGKQVNIGTAGSYLFGAQDDSDVGQIPANNEMIEAVVEAMKQLHNGKGPNCATAIELYGPNGTAARGLLRDAGK